MILQQGFPQIQFPLVDPKTGQITQTWLQLLISLWNRTGQGQGQNTDDVLTLGLIGSDDGNSTQDQSAFNSVLMGDGVGQDDNDQSALLAMMLDNASASSALAVIASITPDPSPSTYTAYAPGNLLIVGGTVTDISIVRGAMTISTGILSGFIPLSIGDQAIVTYAVAPTINFIPW